MISLSADRLDLTAFDVDVLENRRRAERIAAEMHQVRVLALGDRADAVGDTEHLGRLEREALHELRAVGTGARHRGHAPPQEYNIPCSAFHP